MSIRVNSVGRSVLLLFRHIPLLSVAIGSVYTRFKVKEASRPMALMPKLNRSKIYFNTRNNRCNLACVHKFWPAIGFGLPSVRSGITALIPLGGVIFDARNFLRGRNFHFRGGGFGDDDLHIRARLQFSDRFAPEFIDSAASRAIPSYAAVPTFQTADLLTPPMKAAKEIDLTDLRRGDLIF